MDILFSVIFVMTALFSVLSCSLSLLALLSVSSDTSQCQLCRLFVTSFAWLFVEVSPVVGAFLPSTTLGSWSLCEVAVAQEAQNLYNFLEDFEARELYR